MADENTHFSKYFSLPQFIGKSVFDSKGHDCGKIKSVLVDPQKFSISGVIVKKRLSKEYFLSRDYFEEINDSGLSLNTVPIKPGDKVADVDGKNIGKIIQINLNPDTNKLESLEIKSRFRSEIISSDRIVAVGEKIKIKSF
ncbi:PRC-barrel domain-containing protein [Nitrosopumilus sp.]|uniref:PRC-barrel domain-containing protein n=1 Tax=Nitrosopumilus sp. TaxID=2024843 RepID=UPI00247E3B28|nr:PRC-barrel domain-containing protein [Nitrosopumilus sp.]MCV0409834.1 PRC-barrel domain-containing protein [Nitrosopumilus sp.]